MVMTYNFSCISKPLLLFLSDPFHLPFMFVIPSFATLPLSPLSLSLLICLFFYASVLSSCVSLVRLPLPIIFLCVSPSLFCLLLFCRVAQFFYSDAFFSVGFLLAALPLPSPRFRYISHSLATHWLVSAVGRLLRTSRRALSLTNGKKYSQYHENFWNINACSLFWWHASAVSMMTYWWFLHGGYSWILCLHQHK